MNFELLNKFLPFFKALNTLKAFKYLSVFITPCIHKKKHQSLTCAIPAPIKPLPMIVMFFIFACVLVLKLEQTAGTKAFNAIFLISDFRRSLLERSASIIFVLEASFNRKYNTLVLLQVCLFVSQKVRFFKSAFFFACEISAGTNYAGR